MTVTLWSTWDECWAWTAPQNSPESTPESASTSRNCFEVSLAFEQNLKLGKMPGTMEELDAICLGKLHQKSVWRTSVHHSWI